MKPIKLSTDDIMSMLVELKEQLSRIKMGDGELKLIKTLRVSGERISLKFTPLAWSKISALVMSYSSEIGWHGYARRTDDGFEVYDIIVYPQEVAAATVNTDQEQYERFLAERTDEELSALRFHGHSHVDMGVTPSSVDMEHREGILNQMSDDDFYIFIIINKKMKVSVGIYDCAKNIAYDENDVDVIVVDEHGNEVFQVLDEAKNMVSSRKPEIKKYSEDDDFESFVYGYKNWGK